VLEPPVLRSLARLGIGAWSLIGANLLLENVVEPKVMGRTLHIHPLVVLLVTAIGGLLGGMVGLMLAVPVTVVAVRAVAELRSTELLADLADRARPAVESIWATEQPGGPS
jgi:predicted PurR-regulated permease PerM